MTARVAAATFSLLGLLACRAPLAAPEATSQTRALGPLPDSGEAVVETGERHEYELGELEAGAGVHVVLEQRGFDLAAQVVDGADRPVVTVDGPTGAYGFEHACFLARRSGAYRLRIGPASANGSGAYGLRLRERAPPSSAGRIRDCEKALDAFSEAEARRSEASADVAALYRRAIELWRRSGEPFPLAIALKQAGSFHFRHDVDLDTARRYFDEALAVLRAPGPEGEPRQLAGVLNLAGRSHELAGEPERARTLYEEARAVSAQVGYGRGEAAAISNLALWEMSAGDLYRAVELHHEALALWREAERPSQEATTLNLLGISLTRLGRYDEALDVLRDALEIRRQAGRAEPLANTWVAIGWAEHLSGRGEAAVGHFLGAVELHREAGARLGEAGALDRLGSAYRELGRADDARRAFESSLEILRTSGNRVDTAHTASNLGCLLGDEALLDEAGETFAAIGDRAALAHARYCQARLERDAGRLDDALRRIEAAVGLVDQLRGAALRRGHHAPTLELWQEYSQLHVDLLMRLDERDPGAEHDVRAFEISDLARARHLYEMLVSSG